MENFKKWITVDALNYSFEVDGKSVGFLEIIYSNFDRKAVFVIENKRFTLKYNGFWKSNFEIKDENDVVILKSYTEKWFAHSTILEYKDKKLKLQIRNNPLAEYVIFDDDKELLAYGLYIDNGKASVKIETNSNDYLLDYLLWYLFVPIAQENIGEYFVFNTSLTNQ